jgi:hypothetical protein
VLKPARGLARAVRRRGAPPANPAWPRPARPRLGAGLAYRVQRLLRPNGLYRWLASALEASAAGYRLFAATEKVAKRTLFGCRMCGQCALPATGYACPVTCPKQLRNGPCGGVGQDGSCEVFPGLRCVWLVAYERAERQGHAADLGWLQRPIDHRQWGESSWVNSWQGRHRALWAEGAPGGGTAPAAGPGSEPLVVALTTGEQ